MHLTPISNQGSEHVKYLVLSNQPAEEPGILAEAEENFLAGLFYEGRPLIVPVRINIETQDTKEWFEKNAPKHRPSRKLQLRLQR